MHHLAGGWARNPFCVWLSHRSCLFWPKCSVNSTRFCVRHFGAGVRGDTHRKNPSSRAETPTLFVLPSCARSFIMKATHIGLVWRILSQFSESMGQKWQSGLASIKESRSRGGGEDFASWRRHRPEAISVVLLWPRTTRPSWNLLRTSGRRWHMQRRFSKVRRTEPRGRRIYFLGALRRTCPVRLAHLRYHDVWCWRW